MLKNKNLIILVVVLVVLAAISLMQKTSHQKSTSQAHNEILIAGQMTKDDLDRIEIRYGGAEAGVVLVNQPEHWAVASAWNTKANDQRIDTLLRTLSDLAGEFRSDSADVLADYGFADSTMVTITGYGASGSDPVFTLQLGNAAARGVGNFVKLPGSDAVYVASKNILGNLGMYSGPEAPSSQYFLDLQAYTVDRLEVDEITLMDGISTITMLKEIAVPEPAPGDTTGVAPAVDRNVYEWRITAPQRQAAAKTKADGVQNAIVNIRATDVADPSVDLAAYGLDSPARTASIKLQDGTEVYFSFGDNREADEEGKPTGVYMRIGGQSSIWVVNDYNLNNIFKSVEDLLPEE